MKTIRLLVAVTCLLGLLAGRAGAQETDWSADLNRILSRLQSMGHGYYTQAEWGDLFKDIDSVSSRAAAAQAWTTLVDLNIIKAMVFSDMIGEHQQALNLLRQTRAQYAKYKPSNMAKAYVREADVLAKLGDEAGISRLIEEFRGSGFFDPERYSYSGGTGPGDPLRVVRPSARGNDSISVTSMEKARMRARYATGRPFPEFAGAALSGRSVQSSGLQGRVVLVDFWMRGSTVWQRDLPELQKLYQQYQPQGFEILGVCLEPDTAGLAEFVRARNMPWTQMIGNTELPRQLGIFGEATTFLLDRQGVIIGRDLKGANLAKAVREALAR